MLEVNTADTVKSVGDISAGTTIVTGITTTWLGFLNDNAAGLGLILTFVGILITSLFYIASLRIKREESAARIKVLEEFPHLEQLNNLLKGNA